MATKKTELAASEITPSQVEAWKKEYGKIFTVESPDGKRCYLRVPTRSTLSMAAITAGDDSLLQKELILKNCFIGGDRELIEQDKYFYSVARQIESAIEVIECTLKEV